MRGKVRRSKKPFLCAPSRAKILPLIRSALREDLGRGDATSARVLGPSLRIQAHVLARDSGILAGGEMARWIFLAHDPTLRCRLKRKDGEVVADGQVLLTIEGHARKIFEAERTALNWLGHLSGIATLTRRFVDRAQGSPVCILDTRKTLPGLRIIEKYAVAAGGASNHRMRLDDAILIKSNHLRALAGSTRRRLPSAQLIEQAIQKAKQARPRLFVQIEVANLPEYLAALDAQPDCILLDNWPMANLRRAIALRKQLAPSGKHWPLLEVSGGVTLENVGRIARTGVDRISIGRLTHSAPSLDVSLRVA